VSAFAINLAERVLGAYFLTFITLLLANGFDYLDVNALEAAALSAIPAALAVVKGALAKQFGSPDSASFFE
jgi:hypothetical protein